MKITKHILALCLSLAMLFTMIIASGVMTASAMPGAGAKQTTFRAYGADLSKWNVGSNNDHSLVNFAKMKADGCQFVILRIGYEGSSSRTDVLDTAFLQYYKNARAAGMPIGIYFYSLATTYAGAKQDAEWVISQIEKYDLYFEYPIYYDVEDSTYTHQTSLSASKMEQLCLGWCETLEARGYFPGVYGTKSSVLDKLSSSFKAKYDLWYPRVKTNGHGAQFKPTDYDYSASYSMWQYAWYDYEYDGIGLDMLDVNVCYKDYPAIMAQYGYNNCKSSAKTELETLVNTAKTARYDHYTEQNLATLRSVYNDCVALLNNSSTSDATYSAAVTNLKNALANTVSNNESIISVGKSYVASDSARSDIYADNRARLTDGKKGSTDGGEQGAFSGFSSGSPAEIVVDLGGSVASNSYRIHTARMTDWGIEVPAKLSISVSNDGTNFTNVSSTSVRNCTYGSDGWNMFTMTVRSNSTRYERYIKFTIEPNGNHVWLEEVEVMNNPVAATDRLYVTGINKYVTSGDTVIFTPDQSPINTSNHNISYTTNAVATWNGSCYVITSITQGNGPDTASISLNSNQILISAHEWEVSTDNPIIGSTANTNRLKNAPVGSKLTLTNIDINSKTLSAAPSISLELINTAPVEKPDNAQTFWVTHINDSRSEGAGTILTSDYSGAGWWLHVAFAPVSGKENVFEIVNISNGIVDGSATALSIPAGGFVYAINKGNDYPALGLGDTDFTSPNCDAALENALTWAIGDKFEFFGIDPLSPVVCTSTPSKMWYEDGYVCTSYFAPYSEGGTVTPPDTEPETDVKLGDVNLDGSIDQYDYILVKRHYFETRLLQGDEFTRGDVNRDSKVDQYDYILIARHYFGTYKIG